MYTPRRTPTQVASHRYNSQNRWLVMQRVAAQAARQAVIWSGRQAVSAAGRAAGRMFSRSAQTSSARGGPKKSRLGSNIGGKSAGKLSKLKRRKVYKTKKAKRAIKGITLIKETGGSTTDTNCVFVGHSTCPQYTMKLMIGRALGKSLMINAGQAVQSITDSMNVAAGDTISVGYRGTPTGSVVIETFTFVAGSLTVEAFAQWFANILRPWNNVANRPEQYVFDRLTLQTGGNSFWLRLDNAIINVYCKSSFKMQNRSTNVADQEADVVNNIPVFGKRYYGTGTGSVYRNYGAAFRINADNTFGIISAQPVTNSLQEPPQPHEFKNLKSYGKIKIEPGDIKTSVLVYKKSMTIDKMWQLLANAGSPAATVALRNDAERSVLGKFSFMALEKIMDPGSDTGGVSVAWEQNLFIQLSISSYRKDVTIQLFERST